MKRILDHLKPYISHSYFPLITAMVPCLFCLGYFFHKSSQYDNLEQKILYLQEKKSWARAKEAEQQNLMTQMKGADRDYVEKELESQLFLKTEIKRLRALLHSDQHNYALKTRLNFLIGQDNRLNFSQKHFQRVKNVSEVEEVLKHPVEMNASDLKQLLSKIENLPIGDWRPAKHSPQFIVKNFELLRKPLASCDETYVVNLHLIKREIINE